MNCKYVRDLMGAYIYGDLSPEEMKIVRMHTQDCNACKADLSSRGNLISRINHKTPSLSDDDRQRIIWRTNNAISNTSPRLQPIFKRFSPVFAVLGMLIVGYIIGMILSNKPHINNGMPTRPSITNNIDKTTTKEDVTATNKTNGIKAVPDNNKTSERLNNVVETVRRSVTIGTITSRNEEARQQPKIIIIDEPLPVVPSPNNTNTEVKKNDTKMPEPKGLTDAQTAEPSKKL